eukprot:CAMPEP_0168342674 /NCGR_PEP_ID=MMETSP0213-20121227/15548_1 /TAXON_ID=151035 /ORGANISM="Euplotes harpa, Strain FSP1.4" /LENGTH=81 /DNA_ID=CAMNT_0008349643 /DNA_START=42 /DNA_END=287 /DNA_ORIENTATION=+
MLNDIDKFNGMCEEAFKQVDTEKNGQLEKSEMKKCLEGFRALSGVVQFSDKEVTRLISELETNFDNYVNQEEFIQLVREIL